MIKENGITKNGDNLKRKSHKSHIRLIKIVQEQKKNDGYETLAKNGFEIKNNQPLSDKKYEALRSFYGEKKCMKLNQLFLGNRKQGLNANLSDNTFVMQKKMKQNFLKERKSIQSRSPKLNDKQIRSLRVSLKPRPNLNFRGSTYIAKLDSIRQKSSQLRALGIKQTKQINIAQKSINLNYNRLQNDTQITVKGVQKYEFEEEKQKKYKKDLFEMWMRTDR